MSQVDYFAGAMPSRARSAVETAVGQVPAVREQRQFPRKSLQQQYVQLIGSTGTLAAELLDLSITGAKVRLFDGCGPNAGEEIVLRLAEGVERQGAVAWTSERTLGVSLKRPLPRSFD